MWKSSSFPGAPFELRVSMLDLAYCLSDCCSRHGYTWMGPSLTITSRLTCWTSALSWPCAFAEQPHSSGFTWSPSPGLLNPVRPWLVRTGQPELPAPVVAAGQGCGLAAAQGDPQGSFRPNQYLGICILCSVWCIWLFQAECFPLYFTWLSARWISWCFFSFLDHCKKTNKQCNYTDFQRVILKESCYYLQPRHPVVSSVK